MERTSMKLKRFHRDRAPVRLSVLNRTRRQIIVWNGEVAGNLIGRLRGLIGRPPLQPGQGLLIKPCSGIHTFGMSFPIDLAFANAKGQIIDVASRVPPNHLGPIVWRAAYVLELPAGTIEETGTRRGDQLEVVPSLIHGCRASGSVLTDDIALAADDNLSQWAEDVTRSNAAE